MPWSSLRQTLPNPYHGSCIFGFWYARTVSKNLLVIWCLPTTQGRWPRERDSENQTDLLILCIFLYCYRFHHKHQPLHERPSTLKNWQVYIRYSIVPWWCPGFLQFFLGRFKWWNGKPRGKTGTRCDEAWRPWKIPPSWWMQLTMLGEWMLLIVCKKPWYWSMISENMWTYSGRTCGKVYSSSSTWRSRCFLMLCEGPASQLLGFGDLSAQEEWAKIDRDGSGSMDGKELRCY